MDYTEKEDIPKWNKDPKKIFLLDASGALVSAFILFLFATSLNKHLGISSTALMYLSLSAILLFCYSFSCYLVLKKSWRTFMAVLGISNLLYCMFTFIVIAYHAREITPLGTVYFIVETTLIYILASIEFKTVLSSAKV